MVLNKHLDCSPKTKPKYSTYTEDLIYENPSTVPIQKTSFLQNPSTVPIQKTSFLQNPSTVPPIQKTSFLQNQLLKMSIREIISVSDRYSVESGSGSSQKSQSGSGFRVFWIYFLKLTLSENNIKLFRNHEIFSSK